MGDEVSRGLGTNRFCWWLVELGSRLLEPDERDAVRGDLTESRARGGQALREVLGLVLRRQAAMWLDWQPWLALLGVVVPLGLLLSHVSRWWADSHAIYAFLYVNNWTSAFLDSPGSRGDLVHYSTRFALHCLTLIGWSWTSGYVLGSLSRRTSWVTASLFCIVVLAGTVGTTPARAGNAAVFSLTFYRVLFPRLLRFIFVLLPALWGMHRSLRRPSLPLLPTMAGVVALVLLTAWAARGLESSVAFATNVIPPDPGLDGFVGTADDPRPLRLLPLVMVWPVAYMLASASWQRWRGKVLSA